MITYRKLKLEEMTPELFADFHRKQIVTKCVKKVEDEWVIEDNAFVDDWGEEEYRFLVVCLKNTITTGGLVAGAFVDDKLKGFVSVESELFGSTRQYVDLSSIHVSEDMRRTGMGKELFALAKTYSRERGAQKLYISAHPAVESQAFYKAMGCVEAEEYNMEHMEKEPTDCQLECKIAEDMVIRHATEDDIEELTRIEVASYPAAEGASKESITKRVAAFPNHFWLLCEDGHILSFINGMVTNEPDLTDEMYDHADMHDDNGEWQMIFSVVTDPEYRKKGYAGKVMEQVIADAKAEGRKGIVLTCKERLLHFYGKFGFVNEGVSESTHGDVMWYQMRLKF